MRFAILRLNAFLGCDAVDSIAAEELVGTSEEAEAQCKRLNKNGDKNVRYFWRPARDLHPVPNLQDIDLVAARKARPCSALCRRVLANPHADTVAVMMAELLMAQMPVQTPDGLVL